MLTMPSVLQVWNLLRVLGYKPFDAAWNQQTQAVRLAVRALNPDVSESLLREASDWYVDTWSEHLAYASWVETQDDITRPIYFG